MIAAAGEEVACEPQIPVQNGRRIGEAQVITDPSPRAIDVVM
jgi:hypothetical protein